MFEPEDEEQIEIAIIDADSIIYQIAYVQSSPNLCKRDLDLAIQKIMTTTGARTGVIYIKGPDNFRYEVDPEYKGHRKDKTDFNVKERIDLMYEYAQEFAMVSTDGEADDYAAITAAMARKEGKSYIVSHVDKDLDCIPGWHHNFRKGDIYYKTHEEGYMWIMQQLITGGATDNIKGLAGIGPIRANKILKGCTPKNAFRTVVEEWQQQQGKEWLPNFIKCANNIYLREDMEDLRPLTLEELKDRLEWKNMDIGLLSQTDPEIVLDLYMPYLDQQEDSILEESN